MKLLLEHQEENSRGFLRERTNYKQVLATSLTILMKNLKKLAIFLQVAIHFHPSHRSQA